MAGKRIVVVGSINFDLIFPCERIPRPGETLHSHGSETAPGGKGANQALAAARRGGDVAMVGAVGDDAFANQALALLVEAGVDLAAVSRTAGETGVAIVYVQDDGENSILLSAGANLSLTGGRVDEAAEVIESADIVVVQGEIPRSGVEAAVRHCRGRLVVNLAPVIDIESEVLRRADPLVVNEYEGRIALQMLGNEVPKEDADVVSALLAAGVQSLVLTRGGRGALVSDGSELLDLPSPRVDVVDTTGAGDAFVGALAAALADGQGLAESAALAVRVGAFACTGRGAQTSYPRLDDQLPAAVSRPEPWSAAEGTE